MLPRLFYADGYYADIGAHVFPMRKFAMIRRLLLELGRAAGEDIERPAPATDAQVRAVHTDAYVDKLQHLALNADEIRVLELPLSRALVDAAWLVAGGTIAACRRALATGYAANLAGGFHHAFADHGEGFCVINDVAVAAQALLHEASIERVAVLDVDVHHGNGTAAIFAGEPRVFTCSIHQENNYPAWKPRSDLDIGLDDGTDGDAYLIALDRALEAVTAWRPELLIYVAGADPFVDDQLGGLALGIDDLRRRDEEVFGACAGAEVPCASVPAGGYAVRVFDTVSIHVATIDAGLRTLGGGG